MMDYRGTLARGSEQGLGMVGADAIKEDRDVSPFNQSVANMGMEIDRLNETVQNLLGTIKPILRPEGPTGAPKDNSAPLPVKAQACEIIDQMAFGVRSIRQQVESALERSAL
jgi:hypothetical protein